MDYFREFADKLHERWRRAGYDERELPPIAVHLMRSEGILDRIDLQEVLRSAAEGGRFDGLQRDSSFGDLSYIVFNDPRFHIEVLVWTRGTTAIHDHAFSGAFGVLCGDSICVTYDFEAHRRINSGFRIGKLAVNECEHLKPGDVRPILEAPGLIHALYHVACPSATLVVRTHGNPDACPQFSYLPNGIAIARKRVDIVARKQCQALNLLLQMDYGKGEDCTLTALQHAPLDTLYHIVTGMRYGALPGRFSEKIRDCLAGIPYGATIWDSLRAEGERAYLTGLRDRIRPAHLRRFHAAVLNIPDRDHMADFLRRELSEDGCRREVARYMAELAREGVVKWDDNNGQLSEIVCGCLFDRSAHARDRLGKSGDLFLACLAK